MIKWYENVNMLKEILENIAKELEEVEYGSRVWYLLTDESNLIKNHLELIKENQELKDKVNHYKNKFYTTHKSAENIKETIRAFINALDIKNMLTLEDKTTVKSVFNKVLQDLDRLEKLEKAFDKACESLDWDCPEGQNLIDDFIDYFDCENCKNTEKECWKKYFLKEVLYNETKVK